LPEDTYFNPPKQALMLSVDEKTPDRAQPDLPLTKGSGQTMTHDYKRNNATTLFAALITANGEVYDLCRQKHRHRERPKFLRMIDRTVPAGKEIHPICDNCSTHKHERVERRLEARKRFTMLAYPVSHGSSHC
jgi:hypothetical protein